jgi:hypothetical protein
MSPEQLALTLPSTATETLSELSEPSTLTEAYPDESTPTSREPLEVAEAAPIVLEEKPIELLPDVLVAPQPTAPSPSIYRGQRSVIVAEPPSASTSLHAQRYRPPVAVMPVPSDYMRETTTESATSDPSKSSLVQQAIEAPPSIIEAPPSPATSAESTSLPQAIVDANVKLTPLYMKSAQVRSLTVAGELQDIQVVDSSVCRAVAVGPNQLKLIGTGNGITQLVVWAKTDEPNQPIKMRAFEVHVDRVDPAVEAGGSTSELLHQSIRDAFPKCQVELLQEGGQLIVRGRCDSPQSAEKIIRMIRKTCAVPVKDQLIVR